MANELHPLLEPYYTETEPDLRKNKLDAYSEDTGTKADQYRKDLYAARHVDKKHPEKLVDRFLFNLISLATIVKSPGLFPKFRKREVLSILSSMQLDERPLQDPECESVLYWEYRNAVRRYIGTCDDPSYGRTLLGMKLLLRRRCPGRTGEGNGNSVPRCKRRILRPPPGCGVPGSGT